MKFNVLYFVFFSLLVNSGLYSQNPVNPFLSESENVKLPIIYYKLHNGVQLIEIDYNNQEKARVDYEDGKRPISGIRRRSYSNNAIIIRNSNGDLLHQYNLKGEPFKPEDFLPVDKIPFFASHFDRINDEHLAKSNYPSYGKYRYFINENSKQGVIDTLGNAVVDVLFDEIEAYGKNFKESFYLSYNTENENEINSYSIKLNGKWGFVTDKIKIAPKYEELTPLKDNVIRIKVLDKYGLINFMEKKLVSAKYSEIQYYPDFYMYSGGSKNALDDVYGIMNSKFKKITKPIYNNIIYLSGTMKTPLQYWVSKDGKYGALNENGAEISKFKYSSKHGKPYPTYYRTRDASDENKAYFLNLKFNEIGSEYESISEWDNTLFLVSKNYKYGLIDVNNSIIVPCEYQEIEKPLSNNLAVIKKGNLAGVIDSDGKIIIEPQFYYVLFNSQNKIMAVNYDKKMGLFDTDGKTLLPLLYDSIISLDYGIYKVEKNGKYGITDKLGKEITPIKYDEIWRFQNGFCIAKIDFGYGYINSSGKEITHFYFEKPSDFEFNQQKQLTAKAFINGKQVEIDVNGKVL